jgi:Asp-tRNA(Asn)/Glu-tRNA(Gln) amidotransferase B subunit
MGSVLARLKDSGESITQFKIEPSKLAALLGMVRDGSVSNTAAKTIFARMAESGGYPVAIADGEGLRQVGDDTQLVAWIEQVLAANPEEASRFEAGDKKLLGVLVGKVMKTSGGKADPKKVNQLLSVRAQK